MHLAKSQKLCVEATASVEAKSPTAADDRPDFSLVWNTDIFEHITKHLTPNEVVCLRSVNKAAAELFKKDAIVRLSQPVPPWAFQQRWAQPGSCRTLNRAQREKLVSLVAASDVVANLAVALAATGLEPSEDALLAAACAGALATCKHLAKWLPFALNMAFRVAAYAGWRVVCEWILEDGAASISARDVGKAAKYAAEGGQLAIMEWLLEKDPEMLREHMLMCAAWEGLDLPSAQRLRRQHCQRNRRGEDEWDEYDLHNALVGALGDPTPQWRSKVEWLLEQGAQVPQDDDDNEGGEAYDSSEGGWYVTLPFRAVHGRFPGESICERFEWLKSKGHPVDCSCGGEPLAFAILGGYTAAVAWLLKEGATPAAADARMEALLPPLLENKHLGALQALKAAGCLELKDLVHRAAAGGAMAVLEWAGEEWNWAEARVLTPELFTCGAKSGSVEVVRWLLQRGCPTSEGAWSAAADSGCEAAVELLAELGCPMPACGEPYMAAIGEPYGSRGCEWRILTLIHEAGVPFGPSSQGIFTRAVERGAPIATLEWLLDEGCCVEWGEALMAVRKLPAAGAYAPEVAAWLQLQREGAAKETFWRG